MWYSVINGQQQGPFSEEQFTGMIHAGQIILGTPVWREGMVAWQPLEQVRTEFSPRDACEVCQRLAGAEHLVDLNGTRVCATCKPVVLQKMREGIAIMPPLPRRRPVMVWVISLFYFICTPLGALSIFLIPTLASSGIPMSEAQRHYFQSQTVFDYVLAAIGMLLNLAGAILLFQLRRQALVCFGSVFVFMFLNFGYQIAFKNWLQVMASQPGGWVGAAFGLVVSIGINVAIVWYVWYLKEKKILR